MLGLIFLALGQQQVQRRLRVREHDDAAGGEAALQGLPSPPLGGLQLQENLRSHLRENPGMTSSRFY